MKNTHSLNPLVSIGMPVFNGDKHLIQALEAIISQDFEDFELIISNNASTDLTAQICEDYAHRDSRIRLISQSENIGAARNCQLVFNESRGDYFMWAAHDDLLYRNHLSSLIHKHKQGNYILVASRQRHMNLTSGEMFDFEPISADIFGDYPRKAFIEFMRLHHWDYAKACLVYGLYKRAGVSISRFSTNNKELLDIGLDLLFLYEILAHGNVGYIEEVTWQRGERFTYKRTREPNWRDLFENIKKKLYFHMIMKNPKMDNSGKVGIIVFYLNEIKKIFIENFGDLDQDFLSALEENRDLLIKLFIQPISFINLSRTLAKKILMQ